MTLVEGDPKAPFFNSYYTEGATLSPRLLHFTLDPYLVLLSVKQGGIKYHFLSLWYDSAWDWLPVSRTIDDIKLFTKNEKELETDTNHDYKKPRYRDGIWHGKMCHTYKEKWKMMNNGLGMELPNQERIRALGEMENYRYLGILEADIIKQEIRK